MGKFEQVILNMFSGEIPIEFTFRSAKDLISKYEASSKDALEDGWEYCIRERTKPNGDKETLLVKINVEDDVWSTVGIIHNAPKNLKLPNFNTLYSKRKRRR